MRIDAYTHFFPKTFFNKMIEVAGQYKDMGKRVRAIPPLYDLDARKKIIDTHKDYQQIIAYPQPPIEKLAKSPQEIDEFIRIIRGSANRDEARVKLLAFELTRNQVEKIGVLNRTEARLV